MHPSNKYSDKYTLTKGTSFSRVCNAELYPCIHKNSNTDLLFLPGMGGLFFLACSTE